MRFIQQIKNYVVRVEHNLTQCTPEEYNQLGIGVMLVGLLFLFGSFQFRGMPAAPPVIPNPLGLSSLLDRLASIRMIAPYVCGFICCLTGYVLLRATSENTEE